MDKEERKKDIENFELSRKILGTAKDMLDQQEKARKKEPVVEYVSNNGKICPVYHEANPEAYASMLKKQLSELSGEAKDYVYSEIARVAEKAKLEMNECIDTNGRAKLHKLIMTCQAIDDLRSNIEEKCL
jgi:hypothetical protein